MVWKIKTRRPSKPHLLMQKERFLHSSIWCDEHLWRSFQHMYQEFQEAFTDPSHHLCNFHYIYIYGLLLFWFRMSYQGLPVFQLSNTLKSTMEFLWGSVIGFLLFYTDNFTFQLSNTQKSTKEFLWGRNFIYWYPSFYTDNFTFLLVPFLGWLMSLRCPGTCSVRTLRMSCRVNIWVTRRMLLPSCQVGQWKGLARLQTLLSTRGKFGKRQTWTATNSGSASAK